MFKPLGIKAYGSIGHLPYSRMGPGDHHVSEGQARICCEKARDKHDRILVQEKIDGCAVAVALINGEIIPLGRAGYPASSAPYEHIVMFGQWALQQEERFRAILQEGERLVGEWMALAHGTRYDLIHEPWVVFDLMKEHNRLTVDELQTRVKGLFRLPRLLHDDGPLLIEDMLCLINKSGHGAIDEVEGAVWRVERKGKVDFLAKYVRSCKIDGMYLPEISGQPPIWNWRPSRG